MDTEVLATTAIKERVAKSDYLSSFINEGDKEPSWDGNIYAYSDKSKKKDKMIGKAPVQVKGRKNNTQKERISFKVNRADLINYRNDGGVLYFVVYINNSYDKTIYYSKLLPYAINQILGCFKNDKQLVVPLKRLPDEIDELNNIVFDFLRDSRRQGLLTDGHMWSIEEVEKLFGKNIELDFTFSALGVDRDDPFEYLRSHDIYTYAHNSEKTIYIPLHHIEHMDAVIMEAGSKVSVGDKVYYETFQIEKRSDNSRIIRFGKSFELIMGEQQKLLYHLRGTLEEQIVAMKMAIDIISYKNIKIDENVISFAPSEEEIEAFHLEDIKSKLQYLQMIKETLQRLNITTSLDIEAMSEKQEEYLRVLINAINFEKSVFFENNSELAPVANLEIANLKIALTFQSDDKHEFFVNNFFSHHIDCRIDNNKMYPTSQFCILKADDYNSLSNIEYDYMLNDFKKYDNEAHYMKTVQSILEMIKAYDDDNTNVKSLETAEELARWLQKKESSNYCHRLNELQCVTRKRELTDDELEELLEKYADGEMPLTFKIGILILQGNSTLAKKYIDQLNDAEKQEFLKMPIMKLMSV